MKHRALLPFLAALVFVWLAASPNLSGQDDPPALERDSNSITDITLDDAEAKNQPDQRRDENVPWPGFVRRSRTEIVQVGKDHRLKAGETANVLTIVGGNAFVEGIVRHLCVVLGSATVTGTVEDDMVVVLGSLTLGPEARVEGDVIVVGGEIKEAPGAKIDGEEVIVSLGGVAPNLVWLQDWLKRGFLYARPFPPQFVWTWAVAGVLMFAYLGLAVLFPRPARACMAALDSQPIGSFFTGFLSLMLLGPLLFVMMISVVGIFAIPFLLCGFVAACLFGKVAVYSHAGQRIFGRANAESRPLALFLLGGGLLFLVLYMVPVVGFILWGVASLAGLGAAVLALFRGFHREEPPRIPVYAAPPFAGAPPPPAPGVEGFSAAPGGVPPLSPLASSPAISLPRAGFWKRLLATLLDFILLGLLIAVAERGFLLIWAAYHIAMWTWRGTTIGGIVVGIKIIRTDGTPMNFAVALVRSLLSFFSALALGLGFFWAGWDREKQSWHDKIAGTVVVNVPRGMSLL